MFAEPANAVANRVRRSRNYDDQQQNSCRRAYQGAQADERDRATRSEGCAGGHDPSSVPWKPSGTVGVCQSDRGHDCAREGREDEKQNDVCE